MYGCTLQKENIFFVFKYLAMEHIFYLFYLLGEGSKIESTVGRHRCEYSVTMETFRISTKYN